MLRRNPLLRDLPPPGTLTRGYRIDQVMASVAPTDYVYAIQSAPQLFTFSSRRDADSMAVAGELLKINQADRCVHAVFGRPKVPLDFFADIEFPTYENYLATEKGREGVLGSHHQEDGVDESKSPVEQAAKRRKKYTGEDICIDIIQAAHGLMKERFKVTPAVTALFDGGATADKHSYHLHIRVANAAFSDYAALQDLHSEINFAVGMQAIDLACCRPNGMLRLGFTPKFTDRSRVMLPIDAQDAELKRMVNSMHELSEQELMAMTLITRTDELRRNDPGFKTLAGKAKGSKREYDDSGRVIAPHLQESKKAMRVREAYAKVHRLPHHASDEYFTWIRVGLSLYSFEDPSAYQHWLTFSAKSQAKFDQNVCERYWNHVFAKRPNQVWRRGYLYIMNLSNKASKAASKK